MKILGKILFGFTTLLVLLLLISYSWLLRKSPQYAGKLELNGLHETVEIIYDDFGVPHIYANNVEDAYFALGFAQAQERLFQMEMIRRATSGRLSEILGKDLLPIDKIMLTLSIRQAAERSAQKAFENAMKQVDIIGLNIVYGDSEDNIAWWATGKIPVRSSSINSKMILDGADSSLEFKTYYPFDKNPKLMNPADGFICTANNAPGRVDGIEYPGYYFPGYRADRIQKIVNSQNTWNRDEMKRIQNDVKSDRDIKIRDLVLTSVDLNLIKSEGDVSAKGINSLLKWDGEYQINSVGPTIFNSMIFNILQQSMADELGREQFNRLVSSTPMKSSIEPMFFNEASPWWDNSKTKEVVETRNQQFAEGLKLALADLTENLGSDISQWQWGKVHTLTHIHPIGRKEPFDKIFTIVKDCFVPTHKANARDSQ